MDKQLPFTQHGQDWSKLHLFLLYCSLLQPTDVSYQEKLSGKRLLLGDFNVHHHLWGSERNNDRGKVLANFVNSCDLSLITIVVLLPLMNTCAVPQFSTFPSFQHTFFQTFLDLSWVISRIMITFQTALRMQLLHSGTPAPPRYLLAVLRSGIPGMLIVVSPPTPWCSEF